MHGCLSKNFGNDCWLFELDSEAPVDHSANLGVSMASLRKHPVAGSTSLGILLSEQRINWEYSAQKGVLAAGGILKPLHSIPPFYRRKEWG